MRRAWLVVPIGGLVGLPVHVLPVRPIVWLVTSAGLLCVAGVLARSTTLVGAGSGAALLAYALALWIAGPPPDVLGAVAFGLALCLTLEGSHFAARLHGATVSGAVIWRQLLRWTGLVAASVVAAACLDTLAAAVTVTAPVWAYPAIAAAGALGALGGALALLAARPPRT